MASEQQFRVLLVDDHEIVRRGIKTVLQERSGIAIVGESGTVKGGIEETVRLQPDVVIMDLRLPDGSGVEACREIRSQVLGAKVIILTSYADEDALFAAIMAGASGYVLKDLDPTRLQEAIMTVGRGGSLLDPKIATTVLERVRKGTVQHTADDAFSTLSPQEARIFVFIGAGLTNRQIADQLSLSEKTIENYISQNSSKLHVQRRSQGATIAIERRLRKRQ